MYSTDACGTADVCSCCRYRKEVFTVAGTGLTLDKFIDCFIEGNEAEDRNIGKPISRRRQKEEFETTNL